MTKFCILGNQHLQSFNDILHTVQEGDIVLCVVGAYKVEGKKFQVITLEDLAHEKEEG